MAGIVRQGDSHAGHASPTPNPFHATSYQSGQSTVFVNGQLAIRLGDSTSCGDPATGSSSDVYAGGALVHRLGDATGGHGSWVANSAASSSSNVFANGASDGGTPVSTPIAGRGSCSFYNWNTGTCLDQTTDPNAPYYTG